MAQEEARESAAENPAQGGGLCTFTAPTFIIISATFIFDDHLVSKDGKDFIFKLLERDVAKRLSASDAAGHGGLGGLDEAIEVRANAADAVAAREIELKAEKARLTKGRRRGARCHEAAAVVGQTHYCCRCGISCTATPDLRQARVFGVGLDLTSCDGVRSLDPDLDDPAQNRAAEECRVPCFRGWRRG